MAVLADEELLVRDWRLQRLLDLGFDVEPAERLCGTVDYREARRLLDAGCPHELAVRILAPVSG